MNENQEVPPLISKNADSVPVKDKDVLEIQREIIAQIAERLKDPRAFELSYMVGDARAVHLGQEQADYEHGSKRRFLVLDNSPRFGTDQICIALTDNHTSLRPISRGASIRMAYEGKYSTREISLSRFVQTPNQRFRKTNAGICYLLLLSERVPQRLGTVSIKSEASPIPWKQGVPTFAERWREGEAELVSYSVYDIAGRGLDFQKQDYIDILKALKSGRINPSMTQKVAQAEQKYSSAKIASPRLSSG